MSELSNISEITKALKTNTVYQLGNSKAYIVANTSKDEKEFSIRLYRELAGKIENAGVYFLTSSHKKENDNNASDIANILQTQTLHLANDKASAEIKELNDKIIDFYEIKKTVEYIPDFAKDKIEQASNRVSDFKTYQVGQALSQIPQLVEDAVNQVTDKAKLAFKTSTVEISVNKNSLNKENDNASPGQEKLGFDTTGLLITLGALAATLGLDTLLSKKDPGETPEKPKSWVEKAAPVAITTAVLATAGVLIANKLNSAGNQR